MIADWPAGALLMTYGSPASLDDLSRYLTAVRGGREASPDLVAEFTRRYRIIGGSPLVEITTAQAHALEERFDGKVPVRAAMRFSQPSIASGLAALAALGVQRIVGIIMSPQYSPLLMSGYRRDVGAAQEVMGDRAPDVVVAGAWHREPAFLDALAERIRQGLEGFRTEERAVVPVLLKACRDESPTRNPVTLPSSTRRPKLWPPAPGSPATAGPSVGRARATSPANG